jgi:hypothetical protein
MADAVGETAVRLPPTGGDRTVCYVSSGPGILMVTMVRAVYRARGARNHPTGDDHT